MSVVPTGFGYDYLPGVKQYSAGVAAASGYHLTRVQFLAPLPLIDGLRRAAKIIGGAGQLPGALCACELRTPVPFTEAGFAAFNGRYLAALEAFGIHLRDGHSPVARTNVCPAPGLVSEPGLHAFCFTTPSADAVGDFVVSGSAEVPEGLANYRDHVVAAGDVSVGGMLDKSRYVLAEMRRRMAGLGLAEAVPQTVQVYSVHDVHAVLAGPVARFSPHRGLTWHPATPPVVNLEYEMDCRTVGVEQLR